MNFKKALFVLIFVTVISFLPAISADFVNWDDDSHILGNVLVKEFKPSEFHKVFLKADTANKTYIPLTTLTWAIEYNLFGKSPMVFHLTNLALHVAVVLVVLVLAGRLGLGPWGAFAAALIFALHPTRVENVAWVTARKDLLYGLFYLLSICAYLSYLQRGFARTTIRKAHSAGGTQDLESSHATGSKPTDWLAPYLLALVLGFLSILAKPQALSLPWILLLVDWMKGRRFTLSMLLDKVPFFLVIEPIAWITYAQNSREIVLSFPNGFIVWFWSAAFYIQKFLWPGELSPIYAMPEPVAFTNPVYLSVLVTVAITAFVLWRWASNRWLWFAFAFYFLSSFFMWRFDWRDISVVADRYMYIPALAACLGLGRGFEYLLTKERNIRRLSVAALCVTVTAYAVMTFSYCFAWRDGFALWDRVVEASPELAFGYNNRGGLYVKKGDYPAAMRDFNKAMEVASRNRVVKDGKNLLPIKAATQYASAHDNIGQLFTKQKQYEEALKHFNLAIYYAVDEQPDYYNNRAATLVKLKHMDEALADYNVALSLKPDFYAARLNRGLYYYKINRKDAALEDFQKAITIDGTMPEAFMQAGRIYFENNRLTDALSMFKQVLKLEPDNAQALYNIGSIYLNLKDKNQAQTYFSQAQVKWIKDPEKYPLPGVDPADAKIWKERLGK